MEIAVASSGVSVCSEQKVQLKVLYREQYDTVCLFLPHNGLWQVEEVLFKLWVFRRKQLHLLLR